MLPERRGDCSADGDRVPAVASSSGAAVSEQSAIEWTDATWNPVTGCTKVSPGCANCYIERTPPFRMAGRRFVKGAIPVLLHPDRLDAPLRWQKPRRVFVCSLADLFHDDVPDDFIEDIWLTMHKATQHTFQVLTKRPERLRQLLTDSPMAYFGRNPLPNVWLGVSVENQRMAGERIPELLRCPAVVHFISGEPPLGPPGPGRTPARPAPLRAHRLGDRGRRERAGERRAEAGRVRLFLWRLREPEP